MYQHTYIYVHIYINGITLYVLFAISYFCLSVHLENMHLLHSLGWLPSVPACDYNMFLQPLLMLKQSCLGNSAGMLAVPSYLFL